MTIPTSQPVVEPLVDPSHLRDFVRTVCVAIGSSGEIAEVVADHLVLANLSGHDSHGVARLPDYVRLADQGLLEPGAMPSMSSSGATALFDAHNGFGLYSTTVALDWALDSARQSGISMVAIRHSQHIGRLGDYAERAAASGMLAIVTVGMAGEGVGAMVLPGTAKRFFGANPWAFGIPAPDNDSVLVDVSTAVVAEGKVQVAAARGMDLPQGWIVDSAGAPSINPQDYFQGGGLLPLGGLESGHKGYGLGLASALFGGLSMIQDPFPSLVGATQEAGADARGTIAGVAAIVIDPSAFGDQHAYVVQVGETVGAIRRSGDSDHAAIVPGDPEKQRRQERRHGIPVPPATLRKLSELAERFSAELRVRW